jgi:hypothetical protein
LEAGYKNLGDAQIARSQLSLVGWEDQTCQRYWIIIIDIIIVNTQTTNLF